MGAHRVDGCILFIVLLLFAGCGSEKSCHPALLPDGDVNLDCRVDQQDADLTMHAIAGLAVLSKEQLTHADVAPIVDNKICPDGILDIGDVVVILKLSEHN